MADQPRGVQQFPSPDPIERLKFYRLDRFVSTLPTLPPTRGDLVLDPKRDDCKKYYARVPVESLDDLKLWLGFPNDHIDHRRHWQHLKHVPVPHVDPRRQKGGDVLGHVPKQTIEDAEHNVLHGYTDADFLAHPFWSAIVKRLLDRWRFLDILTIADLVVSNGDTVTISGTPTAYFNRVTVHGSGRIVFDSNGKLIADTIEHIP